MAANDIWALISKKLSGEASVQELQALESLIVNDENIKHTIAGLQQIWQTLDNETGKTNTKGIDKRWEVFRLKLIPDLEEPNAISKTKSENDLR